MSKERSVEDKFVTKARTYHFANLYKRKHLSSKNNRNFLEPFRAIRPTSIGESSKKKNSYVK